MQIVEMLVADPLRKPASENTATWTARCMPKFAGHLAEEMMLEAGQSKVGTAYQQAAAAHPVFQIPDITSVRHVRGNIIKITITNTVAAAEAIKGMGPALSGPRRQTGCLQRSGCTPLRQPSRVIAAPSSS